MSGPANQESLCKKCGRCCRRKVAIEGVVFWTPFWCPHLDRETKLCREYARRHDASPSCLSIPEAIAKRALPTDCPYVAGMEGYRGPVELRFWDMPESAQRQWAAACGVSPREFEKALAEYARSLTRQDEPKKEP